MKDTTKIYIFFTLVALIMGVIIINDREPSRPTYTAWQSQWIDDCQTGVKNAYEARREAICTENGWTTDCELPSEDFQRLLDIKIEAFGVCLRDVPQE